MTEAAEARDLSVFHANGRVYVQAHDRTGAVVSIAELTPERAAVFSDRLAKAHLDALTAQAKAATPEGRC